MANGDGDSEGVGLAAAIGQVRRELEQAIQEGHDSDVYFRAGAVELEFEVAVTRTTGLDGGVRVSVVSFGAKREKGATETHRVTISLTPVDAAGNERLIGSEGTE